MPNLRKRNGLDNGNEPKASVEQPRVKKTRILRPKNSASLLQIDGKTADPTDQNLKLLYNFPCQTRHKTQSSIGKLYELHKQLEIKQLKDVNAQLENYLDDLAASNQKLLAQNEDLLKTTKLLEAKNHQLIEESKKQSQDMKQIKERFELQVESLESEKLELEVMLLEREKNNNLAKSQQ